MKKYVLWPLLGRHWRCGGIPAAAASAQHWVRGGHRPPIPGNLYAILLVAWFVVLAAVCLLAARTLLPADREDPPSFPQASPWLPPGCSLRR